MSNSIVPYEARALERIEFTRDQVQVLKNTICRGASDAELSLFTYACQDIGLNPFLHQIWAITRNVKVGDKYEKQLTIQVGIDGYRVIRDRLRDQNGAALFEGMDGPQWSDDGTTWLDYPMNGAPKFARVGIWRRGIPRPFVAVARWDAYNQGNAMWQKMGPEQLAKCAEALGLRRAFPAEMSGLPSGPVTDYPGEESDAIEGQVVSREPDPAPDPPRPAPAPPVRDHEAADYGATTRAILAVLKDIKESQGEAVATDLKDKVMRAYPETRATDGRFYPTHVKPEHAAELLDQLRSKQGGPPAETSQASAEPAADETSAGTSPADDVAADNARADTADAEFEALRGQRGQRTPAAEPAAAGQGTLLNPRGGTYS